MAVTKAKSNPLDTKQPRYCINFSFLLQMLPSGAPQESLMTLGNSKGQIFSDNHCGISTVYTRLLRFTWCHSCHLGVCISISGGVNIGWVRYQQGYPVQFSKVHYLADSCFQSGVSSGDRNSQGTYLGNLISSIIYLEDILSYDSVSDKGQKIGAQKGYF